MPTKKRAKQLLAYGYQKHISDIYIFPVLRGYEISFRQHRTKEHYTNLNTAEAEQLILYFKYLAGMDVAEKRKTQVGACIVKSRRETYHLRLSTVADFNQKESLVIRLLDSVEKQRGFFFFPNQYEQLISQLTKRGLYIFSGSVGSGKTTTMYQIAKATAKNNHQVITIEDPVEIPEPDFLQLQVNSKINLTYESLIKACLRHRPDLLIVGEIRDQETAANVVRAALTGHTVFTTIHARNKYGVLPRLMDLKVSLEELKQCLEGIIYQRILPKACPLCIDERQNSCMRCSVGKQQGVIYDWLLGKEVLTEFNGVDPEQSWNKLIRKAWAIGGIDEKTFQQEQQISN